MEVKYTRSEIARLVTQDVQARHGDASVWVHFDETPRVVCVASFDLPVAPDAPRFEADECGLIRPAKAYLDAPEPAPASDPHPAFLPQRYP